MAMDMLSIGAVAKMKKKFAHDWVDRTRGKILAQKQRLLAKEKTQVVPL